MTCTLCDECVPALYEMVVGPFHLYLCQRHAVRTFNRGRVRYILPVVA